MKNPMKNFLATATVGGWRKLKLLAVGVAVIGLALAPAWADGNAKKTFLIHAKTSLKLDDAQICAVPNVAWAALAQGYQVTILFDASGVTALKKEACSAARRLRSTRRVCRSGSENHSRRNCTSHWKTFPMITANTSGF